MLALGPQQTALLALPVAALLGLALVPLLLALGEAELDLGDAARVEVERERHEGHALARDGADQAAQLALVDEQLSRPLRLVVELVAAVILGDMGVEQPQLAAHLAGMRVGDLHPAFAQR